MPKRSEVDPRYSIDDIDRATGGRHRAAIEELAAMVPLAQRDDDRLTPLAAAAIGAVLAIRGHTRKMTNTRHIFRQLVTGEAGPVEDWMVVRFNRNLPQIVDPPVKIEVTSPGKARPLIYDPLGFLNRLGTD